jgi:hypothetical protein
MPPSKFKISLADESKAIATITTFLSALIQKLPQQFGIKEYLLILAGFLGYFIYHVFLFCQNFFNTHIRSELSLAYASYRIKNISMSLKTRNLTPIRHRIV